MGDDSQTARESDRGDQEVALANGAADALEREAGSRVGFGRFAIEREHFEGFQEAVHLAPRGGWARALVCAEPELSDSDDRDPEIVGRMLPQALDHPSLVGPRKSVHASVRVEETNLTTWSLRVHPTTPSRKRLDQVEIQGQLPPRAANAAEQENIYRAQGWALARRRELLTEKFVKNLHDRMLGDVWRWAGKFRTSEQNLGIPHYEIPMALRQLLDDARTWIEHGSYPPDEIANLQDAGDLRRRHMAALQAADNHEIGPLLAFARSCLATRQCLDPGDPVETAAAPNRHSG